MSASPQARSAVRLYVSNLSHQATLTSMRELFRSCGEVLDVEFAAERSTRALPSAAYITMANGACADKAVHSLHGRLHEDRVLMVSRLDGPSRTSGNTAPRARGKAVEDGVLVTQQYRDRRALTYELTSAEQRVALRFIFPEDDAAEWQLEVRVGIAPEVAESARGKTRQLAFQALREAACKNASPSTLQQLDWDKAAAALRGIKAL